MLYEVITHLRAGALGGAAIAPFHAHPGGFEIMYRRLALVLAVAVLALPAAAAYRSFPELRDTMFEAQQKRAEGVSDS